MARSHVLVRRARPRPGRRDESGRAGTSEGHLVELFRAAGLDAGRARKLTVTVPYATFEEWWHPYTLGVGPAGDYVAGLDSAGRDAWRPAARELLPGRPVRGRRLRLGGPRPDRLTDGWACLDRRRDCSPRLERVAPVVAVASGKGGVGKTSVAVALARELVRRGHKTGLLDADLHGPDVPRMLGIRRDRTTRSVTLTAVKGERNAGLEAVEVDGLKVASVGFLLGGSQGLTMTGQFAELMLGRLVKQTVWGELDVLVADLPPGTGEVQQGLVTLSGDVSAVLVVTPAEVSHLDTSRAIAVLRQAEVPLLGGVENMAYVLCPHCGERTALHTPAPEDRTIWALGVPKLAGIPFRTDAVVTPGDVGPVADAVEAQVGLSPRYGT